MEGIRVYTFDRDRWEIKWGGSVPDHFFAFHMFAGDVYLGGVTFDGQWSRELHMPLDGEGQPLNEPEWYQL